MLTYDDNCNVESVIQSPDTGFITNNTIVTVMVVDASGNK